MDFKTYLRNVIKAKETRAAELRKQIKESNDANEVRALGETLQSVLDELSEAKKQLDNAENKDDNQQQDNQQDGGNEDDAERQHVPANAQQRGGNPLNSYMQNPNPAGARQRNSGILDSMEYRKAFAQYIRTGNTEQFVQFENRDDATLISTDVGKVIPNTIMNEFIKELKVYGNLYNRVRKLNVRGGVEFPIEELVPTVKWISETTVSDTQKAPELKTSVSFGYYICEARIAQSLLSQVVSLPVLETEIARLLAEAFIKEFDRMIINGTGTGQPTGILTDARVAASHKIAFTAEDMADWTKWRTKLFAKIPLAYRGQGVLVMTANTWETYIMTLKDDANRPLYTETYDPTNGNLTCRFAGREVILVEPDIIKDFDTATSGEAFVVYFKPADYAINSNLQIGFKRYFNDDNNKWVNKGLCIVDGKLLDANGVFILKK